jgi:hypothetical protein
MEAKMATEKQPPGKQEQEANLGQREAQREKKKQSELSHMGESAKTASRMMVISAGPKQN